MGSDSARSRPLAFSSLDVDATRLVSDAVWKTEHLRTDVWRGLQSGTDSSRPFPPRLHLTAIGRKPSI